jgi:hypothetical protein
MFSGRGGCCSGGFLVGKVFLVDFLYFRHIRYYFSTFILKSILAVKSSGWIVTVEKNE